jgi:hypothetical protein
MDRLPYRATVSDYQHQADALLNGWSARDESAVEFFWRQHPRFRRPDVLWLPRQVEASELQTAVMTGDDARLAIARWYDFRDWAALTEWAESVGHAGSPISLFESAVEAVIDGDAPQLERLLQQHPDLIRARSTRVTWWAPPQRHRATLLHYVAANGVEGYRQKTPANAVDIATILLRAGAEVDALADMYEGKHTTMSMLVSSGHPAKAGLQVALTETLLDFGASVNGAGEGAWTSPVMTALVFGYSDTAQALARRGARVDTVAAAAGLDRVEDVHRLLPRATAAERHVAMALAAQLGHVEIVRALLDAGEDPNRHYPQGAHAHSTPLHQAAAGGREDVVRLLVERGARLDIRDTIYNATPLGWAEYCAQPEIATYLRAHGAL